MLYFWIDILGTVAFAISGAQMAMAKRLDVFGVLIIAFVTSIGGGTIRDLLIGVRPVSWLQDITYTYVIIGAVAISVIFRSRLKLLSRSLFLFDAIGIGLYTVVGIERGISAGLHPILCVALGTISACFGGVSRDILCNEIPIIFHKEIYATACILGGIMYFALLHLGRIDRDFVPIAAISVVILVRMYAVIYKKSLPSLYGKERRRKKE